MGWKHERSESGAGGGRLYLRRGFMVEMGEAGVEVESSQGNGKDAVVEMQSGK